MKYIIKNVDEMNIDELIGQVIMIGLPGLELNQQYLDFIKDYKIGNYILFARNYDNTKQMKNLMHEVYKYTEDVTGSFPLVSIDQEGGMVVRLFKDVTFPASPLTTSATTVKDAPYKTGFIVGKDMMKLGVNLNLAPCLEIDKDLSNPLTNVRIYGSTKEMVLSKAREFVRGIKESNVLSCIKHFPGDGSSAKDSHLELPIIDDSKEEVTVETEGKELEIGFNPRFLMDVLKVVDDEEICMYMRDAKSPCIIKDENESYVYVILPVNINASAY